MAQSKSKTVVWDKAALEIVREFSLEVRQEIGALLRLLQNGEFLGMPRSRPVKNLAPSAFELRVKDRSGIYRVFYVYYDKHRIIVPHAFTKKTQRTPLNEIETARKRLKRLIIKEVDYETD